ncbi:MAG: hypothetical protein KatS3mg090_0801 [Patescibacteria group bacterium]|nr:MAG: hypothetical protein KatS3mg090_0801 [Patescibacteria group bacterium]
MLAKIISKVEQKLIFYLLCFVILTANFGLLTRLSFTKEIRFTIFEVLVYIFVLIALLKIKKDFVIQISKFKFLNFFLVYSWINFAFNSTRYNQSSIIIGVFYLIRITVFLLLFPILYTLIKNKYLPSNPLIKIIKLSAVLQVIIAIAQILWYPNLRNLQYLGWDPHYFRVFSVYLDTYLTNNIFVLFAFFSLYNNWTGLFLLHSLLSLATYARAGIMLFGIALLFNKRFLAKIKLFFLILAGAVTLILFFLNPYIGGKLLRSDTVISRIEDSKQALELIKKNILFGIGFNFIGNYKKEVYYYEIAQLKPVYNSKSYFHNLYLSIWATTGIIGFCLFLLALVQLLNLYRFPDILIYVLTYSLIDNALFNVFVLFYLSLFLNLLKFKYKI